MKKLINLKEIMIIILSIALVSIFTTSFAVSPVLGDEGTSTIPANEYENAQIIQEDNNTINNTTNNSINDITNNNISTNNNSTNNSNSVKTYNTSNTTDLPQTGIEDYNIGILLIICVASAIFAYKKVNDYKNI